MLRNIILLGIERQALAQDTFAGGMLQVTFQHATDLLVGGLLVLD
ncbi:MAG: hypothetical protein VW600_21385 [Ferrovibrio sp.]